MKVLVLACCALAVVAAQVVTLALPQQGGQQLQLPQQPQQPVYIPILGPLGVPIEPPEVQNARAAHIIFFNREAARAEAEQQEAMSTSTERPNNQISNSISEVQAATGIGQTLIQNTNQNNQMISGNAQIMSNNEQGVSGGNQMVSGNAQNMMENGQGLAGDVQLGLGNNEATSVQVSAGNNNVVNNQAVSGSNQIIVDNSQTAAVQVNNGNNVNNQVLSGNNQATSGNNNEMSENMAMMPANLESQFGLRTNQMVSNNAVTANNNQMINNNQITSGSTTMVTNGNNEAPVDNNKTNTDKETDKPKPKDKEDSLNFYLQDTPEVAAAKTQHFILFHKYAELAAKDNGTWGNGTWVDDVDESTEQPDKDQHASKENAPMPRFSYEQMLGSLEKRERRSIISKSVGENKENGVESSQRLTSKSQSSSTIASFPATAAVTDKSEVPKSKAQHRTARKYAKTRKIKKHPSPSRAHEQRKYENQETTSQHREHQIQRPTYYNEEK